MSKRKWYQKSTYLLIALALALLAGIPFMPQAAASPGEATFYSNYSDGYLKNIRFLDYHSAQQDLSGSLHYGGVNLEVGQWWWSNMEDEYWIYRGALFFDTSSLPDDATISSAVLCLYGCIDHSDVDFDITVVDGSVLHEPLVGADYGALRNQTVSGGSFNTSAFSTSGYNDIPLNETGMGWISKTGITKFGLRSSRDISAADPILIRPRDEDVYVLTREYTGGNHYWPKLVVTYTTPPPPPVGGEAYPVNKLAILVPWIAFCAAAIAGASILLRRRGAQE